MNPRPTSSSAAHVRLVSDGSDTSAGAPVAAAQGDAQSLVESYQLLADVFHDVLAEQSIEGLLDRIADALTRLIPYDDMHVYEVDMAKREMIPRLARSSRWAAQVLAERFPFGAGITGWAVEHREPVLANQAHLDPRVRFVPGTPIEPEALIVVPLIARGAMKGTMNIYREGEDVFFTEDEFHLATRFGDAAALALDNAHIRASLEHQAQTDPLTGLYNHRTFHELLREELLRASSVRDTVALVMVDLDDFKRVNDIHGHALGDQILAEVANLLRAGVRDGDTVFRIGGEEFAIIAPAVDLRTAEDLSHRLAQRIASTELEAVGSISVSVGVAVGPDHAANPRELVACAEAAMMTAKSRGKQQIVLFDDSDTERPETTRTRREDVRSIAHLKMLQSVSGKLGRLNDVREIGETVANELRQLIDYHNCRVFTVEGDRLSPIAFRGELTGEATTSAMDVLTRAVGEGITGHVAATGEALITGDAANCEYGVPIPGTESIEESLLAVPLKLGSRVVGVIVISKLGLDQFDADDLRLLEVLAAHAAVALVNAQLYEEQRREAESAKALLELSQGLSSLTELNDVTNRIAEGSARILGSRHASVWLPSSETEVQCAACWSEDSERRDAVLGSIMNVSAARRLATSSSPYMVEPATYESEYPEHMPLGTGFFAVAPLHIEGRSGCICVEADAPDRYGSRELEQLGGIASQAKLAISNALAFGELERTFLSTVEALANALEAKDEYTHSHARWITDMSLRVGHELGLDEGSLKRLELGALFHDIGKIGIPADILLKPQELDAEERKLIEMHPELGERILAPIEQLAQVRPIVRACHERWDGDGYPDGLQGETIPLEARIIFACDAFHAMTTDRPYRERLPVDEAERRLREASGSQFDPQVIDAAIRVLRAEGVLPPE
jgi:diguanylate cyclase (GGDEF)-like protein